MVEQGALSVALCQNKIIAMALVELKKVNFEYSKSPVVRDLDLAIENRQIVSIMGPSGCGKSTVLRLISGLEAPLSGECLFEGKNIERPSPKMRFSFQDFDAFPWKTVRNNLLLGGASENGGANAFDIEVLLQKIGLAGHENKYPAELSGGMRKRLALGRCLAGKPQVILLDEPFSSLDMDAKQEMYTLLQNLWNEWQCLFVIVTHDIHEALFLSRQIIISEPLPFRKKEIIEIPFSYPRDDSIITSSEFFSLASRLRHLL